MANGLAMQAVEQNPVDTAAVGMEELRSESSMPTVGQVVAMLEQGADPEKLVQMGIPIEIVQAAMEQIMAKQQVPEEQAGLAGMHRDMQSTLV